MPFETLGEVKSFCTQCQEEFVTSITVSYQDYASNDMLLSGCNPDFGDKPKISSWITESKCKKCKEEELRYHEELSKMEEL